MFFLCTRSRHAERNATFMTTPQRNGTRAFTSRANRSASSSTRQEPDGRVNARARYAKYIVLARAAALTGDAVETENYYQHAEHYFRVMNERTE
jgi:hypothetical protein